MKQKRYIFKFKLLQTRTLLLSASSCGLGTSAKSISFPELSNFLRRMLDENKGSGKDQFLGDPDWLSEMQYNKISLLSADYMY